MSLLIVNLNARRECDYDDSAPAVATAMSLTTEGVGGHHSQVVVAMAIRLSHWALWTSVH